MTFAAVTATAVLLCCSVAGDPPREAPYRSVSVSLVAVSATHQGHEERRFDRSTASIREAFEDLKQFDDFRSLRTLKTTAVYGEETKIPIDARYTLILRPIERASHDRIRCNIRVDMRLEEKRGADDKPRSDEEQEPEYREVLRCTLLAVSDKAFKVGGLKLDEGLLVLVLTLTDPATDS